jgi:hypothetical protein
MANFREIKANFEKFTLLALRYELSLITQKNNFVSQKKFVSTQSITQHKNDFYNTKVEDFMCLYHIFLNSF